MATQTRKQSNTAPRHLKSPETPKGASRQEVTAAHRRRHRAERKRPRRRSNSERLYYEKLLPYAEEKHRGNQRALRTGVGWLFALPVVLLAVQRLTDSSKIAILLAWIVGMFIISAALIHIAFADYELQEYLKDLTALVPQVESAEQPAAGERERRVDHHGRAAARGHRAASDRAPRRGHHHPLLPGFASEAAAAG